MNSAWTANVLEKLEPIGALALPKGS
jgi:hypothetical protein